MALSDKARKIGERRVFPSSDHDRQPGMTYRQWLIGQRISAGILGDFMIEQVDQILELLAAEESK